VFKKQSDLLPVFDHTGVKMTEITVTYHFYKEKKRFLGVEFLFDENVTKYSIDILKMWINHSSDFIPLNDFYHHKQINGYIRKEDAEQLLTNIAKWFSKKAMSD